MDNTKLKTMEGDSTLDITFSTSTYDYHFKSSGFKTLPEMTTRTIRPSSDDNLEVKTMF